jgi:hypothetical protein
MNRKIAAAVAVACILAALGSAGSIAYRVVTEGAAGEKAAEADFSRLGAILGSVRTASDLADPGLRASLAAHFAACPTLLAAEVYERGAGARWRMPADTPYPLGETAGNAVLPASALRLSSPLASGAGALAVDAVYVRVTQLAAFKAFRDALIVLAAFLALASIILAIAARPRRDEPSEEASQAASAAAQYQYETLSAGWGDMPAAQAKGVSESFDRGRVEGVGRRGDERKEPARHEEESSVNAARSAAAPSAVAPSAAVPSAELMPALEERFDFEAEAFGGEATGGEFRAEEPLAFEPSIPFEPSMPFEVESAPIESAPAPIEVEAAPIEVEPAPIEAEAAEGLEPVEEFEPDFLAHADEAEEEFFMARERQDAQGPKLGDRIEDEFDIPEIDFDEDRRPMPSAFEEKLDERLPDLDMPSDDWMSPAAQRDGKVDKQKSEEADPLENIEELDALDLEPAASAPRAAASGGQEAPGKLEAAPRASSLGSEGKLAGRLAAEIFQAASAGADLSLILIEHEELTPAMPEYARFAAAVEDSFGTPDPAFERGRGGFAVILPGSDSRKAVERASEFYKKLDYLAAGDAGELQFMPIFIGLSSRAARPVAADRLIAEAEAALRKAKEDSESHIVAFRPDPERYKDFLASR